MEEYTKEAHGKPTEDTEQHTGSVGPYEQAKPKEEPEKQVSEVSRSGRPMNGFASGAIRENKSGKGRCDLLPMCALIRLSKRFEEGNIDHPERNWEKGIPMHSFMDSAFRHLFKYMDGQTDEDHLCAAAWNILCAMWTEEKRPEMQDIPTRKKPCEYPHTDPLEVGDD